MRHRLPHLILLMLFATGVLRAQRQEQVTGSYRYILGENDDITLRDAKEKAIQLARAEAIKSVFGEMITSDVIDTQEDTGGEASQSYFWENTVAMAKGDWLGDTKEPDIRVTYEAGKLSFDVTVWGEAREIVQSKTDIRWSVMGESSQTETLRFHNKDRILVRFSTPVEGYVAVYLITQDDETACLLPYPNSSTGLCLVRAGQSITFFDKGFDSSARHYRLTTSHATEQNQLVLIFSPNKFTRCTDISRDPRHPNVLTTHDFQKWLLRSQRSDRDMMVDKKWVTITGGGNS